jgi:hypothetical protein
MLELIVATIVVVTHEFTVMVALVLVRNRCNLGGGVIGQHLHRVSKPRVMCDPTAE